MQSRACTTKDVKVLQLPAPFGKENQKELTLEGIEPPTFRSGVERAAIAPQSQLVAYNSAAESVFCDYID